MNLIGSILANVLASIPITSDDGEMSKKILIHSKNISTKFNTNTLKKLRKQLGIHVYL